MTLFHLVSGGLPFTEQSAAALSVSIAGDLDKPSPDVRDRAPEIIRSSISSAFAAVISKGMEKRIENRYQTIDEFASDLHGCLVQRGESLYSAFISYRVFSQKYHAMMLYDVLNNTTTPAGHRVIVFLDVKRLVKGEDWEDGFSSGLLNSLVALPLLSAGVIDPMVNLKGHEDDPQDNVAKELLIMQAIQNMDEDSVRKLETIFPILVGKPCRPGDPHYPCSGNFFSDGSNHNMKRLANTASPTITKAVAKFLQRVRLGVDDEILKSPISTMVKDLFALQGAQLWNHAQLAEEEIGQDSEVWMKVVKDPPDPPLDLQHLRMLKAEFRALVPSIHEVIDRAHANALARRRKKDQLEAKRKELLHRVILRMSSETLTDAFFSWKISIGDSERQLKTKLRSLRGQEYSTASNGERSIIYLCCQMLILSTTGPRFDQDIVVPSSDVIVEVHRSNGVANSNGHKESSGHIQTAEAAEARLNGQAADHYSPFYDVPTQQYSPLPAFSPSPVYIQQGPAAAVFMTDLHAAYRPY